MKKGDLFSARAINRRLVNQTHTGVCRLFELAEDVISPERDVVDPLPFFGNELRNRAVRTGGFQQLQMNASHIEKSGSHPLGRNLFASLATKAKRLFIVRDRLVERANRNSQMVDFLDHGA